eukprot:13065114-Ditylum_brightwellii.AAC.1
MSSEQEWDIDMTFVQVDALIPGTNNMTRKGVTCYGCQATCHYHNKCPIPVQLLQCDYTTTDLSTSNNIVDDTPDEDHVYNYIVNGVNDTTSGDNDDIF